MMQKLVVVMALLVFVVQGALLYDEYVQGWSRPVAGVAVKNARRADAISISAFASRGRHDAPVVLLEFSDYQCPFCARYAIGTGVEVESMFVATGRVQHVFVDNPLPIHPDAVRLATAAICGARQVGYWQIHDKLFSRAGSPGDTLVKIVRAAVPDPLRFDVCTSQDSEAMARVEQGVALARELDLGSTPSFGVARRTQQDKVIVEKVVLGAQPVDAFRKAIADVEAIIATQK